MRRKSVRWIVPAVAGMVWPLAGYCQDGMAGQIGGLQSVLDSVYQSMIASAGQLIGIARGIAGFAAIWYIGFRVWGHIGRAEAVDIYPLLRPFGIGVAILLFPSVIGLINGVMQPTVSGTAALVKDSNQAVADLLQKKQAALEQSDEWRMYVGPEGKGDLSKWEELSGNSDDGVFSGISNRIKFEMAKISYNMKNAMRVWLSEILQILFQAAALCVNTIRTFWMIVLAILGPLAFGLSVFDGMRHVLTHWFARYVNVFLWLPIANILGSLINTIEQQMIKLDIAQLQATGQTSFSTTDTAYMIFLVLGIASYFTVPSIANYIIRADHAGSTVSRVSRMVARMVTR